MRILLDQRSHDEMLSKTSHPRDCYIRGAEYLHHLYLDGVKRLTVFKGLTEAELQRFMQLWRDTLDEHLGDTQTFSTRVWEEDFEAIEIFSTDSFGEGAKGLDGRTSKERLQWVVDTLSGGQPDDDPGARSQTTGEAGPDLRLRRMARIAPEDVRALKARGIPQLTEGDLQRVRTCEAHDCTLVFEDTTRSGRRRWCSMALCGNRMKVAAFRSRAGKRRAGADVDGVDVLS